MPLTNMPNFTEEEKNAVVRRVPEIRTRLLNNRVIFDQYPDGPILKVGDIYEGIWLEHNQDNYFLAEYDPETAWRSQDLFLKHQREDGLIPFVFPVHPKDPAGLRFGQVQCVWSAVRCALEIARKTGRPEGDLRRIYECGTRYDRWFETYRNTMGTGLAEMFCEFDTGHDNDPRVTDGGIPKSCPEKDAARMPGCPVLPILSVDLSAMLYGGRIALAELAGILGKSEEQSAWLEKARILKEAIIKYLYDPEDHFYYDRNKDGFRKYRTEHVTRLFLNRVLTQQEFDEVYDRYFTVPGKGFCAPYPIPSVAVDDPHFDRNCPKNSWGCNTQALTALRAVLWMDHYRRAEDLTCLLARWLRAFCDHPESTFQQELHPFTGAPVGEGVGYATSLLIYLEAVKRLGW